MSTLRCLVFTLNNPLENDGCGLCDWIDANCKYAIIGCETGEEGTFHWQGYCELNKQFRFKTVCQAGKWHIEPRRGTQAQAIEYCKKDNNYIVQGIPSKSGARTDIDEARKTALKEGMRAVSARHNNQVIKVCEKFLTYNEKPRDWGMEVIYITGPSGCGKSRRARELIEARGYIDDYYTKNDNSKWWDGYDGHKAVIIDDFRDSWWGATEMLRIMDRYECRIEVKGGFRQLRPVLLIITSIKHPESLYSAANECQVQFLRRITQRICFWDDCTTCPVPEVGG